MRKTTLQIYKTFLIQQLFYKETLYNKIPRSARNDRRLRPITLGEASTFSRQAAHWPLGHTLSKDFFILQLLHFAIFLKSLEVDLLLVS